MFCIFKLAEMGGCDGTRLSLSVTLKLPYYILLLFFGGQNWPEIPSPIKLEGENGYPKSRENPLICKFTMINLNPPWSLERGSTHEKNGKLNTDARLSG